jgi:hypothetical protein
VCICFWAMGGSWKRTTHRCLVFSTSDDAGRQRPANFSL